MAARERAEWKRRERANLGSESANLESESEAPTVDEAEAAGKGGSAAT